MLGKTAGGIFWMYRYLERAENTARLIETGQRIALTRLSDSDEEWRSVLQSAGALHGFEADHEEVTKDAAINWLLRSKKNTASVYSCIAAARRNARLVRTAITGEVWEAINACWMGTDELLKRHVPERDLPRTLGAIRRHTALVRGMTHGTMLRNDEFDFARIGTFLERADNTARILDVKYYVLLPSARSVGSALDNVQWETILRSVSARGGFRVEYGAEAGPRDITHFLILDRRLPRSLVFCTAKLRDNLRYLDAGQKTPTESLKKAEQILRKYLTHDVDAIFEFGLHEFVQEFIFHLGQLAHQIEIDFRFYE